MHKNFASLLAFTILLFMTGCDQTTPNEEGLDDAGIGVTENPNTGDKDLRTALVNMGFRSDMIVEHDDYFIVEGDITIGKQDIADHLENCANPDGQERQWVTSGLVNLSNAWDISVRIDPSMQTNHNGWISAIYDAILDPQTQIGWNAVNGSSIRFRLENESYTPNDNNSLDITVYADTSPNAPACHQNMSPNVGAAAKFPSGGMPGNAITINKDNPYTDTHEKKISTFLHELGHTIGFRHTNWQARGEPTSGGSGACSVFGANLVSGTPQTDSNSLMNGGELGTVRSVSFYDGVALAQIYPRNASTPPPAPKGLHVGNLGSYGNAPLLRWGSTNNTNGYNVYRCDVYGISMPGGCFSGWNYIAHTTTNNFRDNAVTMVASPFPGVKYPMYLVASTNPVGTSYQSNFAAPSYSTIVAVSLE